MIRIRYVIFLIIIFLPPVIINPQDKSLDKDSLFKKYMSNTPVSEMNINNQSNLLDSLQEALSVEKTDASIEYYRRLVADYHHGQKVFEWQLASSHIIFWLVILLVISGIVLSWLQFTKSDPYLKDAEGNPISSVLKFSFKSGIEISSPVLGVLILVISMIFFYFYLVEVYQIRLVK